MPSHNVEHRQDDMDVITAVPRGLNVIKNFVRNNSAVRKLIELEEEAMKQCDDANGKSKSREPPKQKEKRSPCDSPAAGGEGTVDDMDPCKDLCRRMNTSITLEELTPPRKIKPSYKHSVMLDDETFVGRAFPVKFRIRRRQGKCSDCGNEKHLFSTPTENTNVITLANCCDVMVWPSQKVEQMNKVPVTLISGMAQLTEFVLEEPTIM